MDLEMMAFWVYKYVTCRKHDCYGFWCIPSRFICLNCNTSTSELDCISEWSILRSDCIAFVVNVI